jgi:hypothetical protein
MGKNNFAEIIAGAFGSEFLELSVRKNWLGRKDSNLHHPH